MHNARTHARIEEHMEYFNISKLEICLLFGAKTEPKPRRWLRNSKHPVGPISKQHLVKLFASMSPRTAVLDICKSPMSVSRW